MNTTKTGADTREKYQHIKTGAVAHMTRAERERATGYWFPMLPIDVRLSSSHPEAK